MWYRISFNPDPDIMGSDTQVKNLHGNALDFKDKLWDVTYIQSLKFDSLLDYVEIKGKSKFTDILWDYSLQGRALIISEKTKSILDEHKLLNADFYPTIVKKGNQSRNYYCVRLTGDISHRLDYKRSEFVWYKSNENKDSPIKLSNAAEMHVKEKEVGPIDSIRAISLFLEDSFIAENYDMFFLGDLAVGKYWVNERLKRRLEDEGLVGFTFKESGFIMNGG